MKKIKVVKAKEPKTETKVRRQIRIPRWVLSVVIVVALTAIALIWAVPKLPIKPQTQSGLEYKGVIELWNVETFEGGFGSRSSWLTNKSAKFESAHKGLFVHVTSLTVTELRQKLSDGQTFDMICFSRGAGDIVKQYLSPITDNLGDVRENLLQSGQIDGKQYAAPLYAGAYCLFARSSQLNGQDLLNSALTATYTRKVGKNTVELKPLICGFTDFNSPLTSLAMSGGKGNADFVSESLTQYQAYEQFVANNTAVTLLGTQRDMYRLSQKESQSKIDQLSFVPLSGYNDLVQYVGISATCGDKQASCAEYIKFLLSDAVQSALVNVGMFSVLNKSIYTQERYVDCENLLSDSFVPSAFVSAEIIANQRLTAKSTLAI